MKSADFGTHRRYVDWVMLNVRRSLRSLASRPILTAVAIATLALGLGVNAAIFSLIREVLLRPLPYRDADRLVRVFEVSRARGVASAPVAPVNYVGWRNQVDAFEQSAVFRRVAVNVSLRTSAVQVEGFQVAPTFFPMLGIDPALGRGFTAEDAQPGHDAIVLLSNGFWRHQFAGDSAIVGQLINVDGIPCTVIGVLPSDFKIFRILNREIDLFRPLVLETADREQSINVYAKLKPGVSLDLARAQLRTRYSSLPIPDNLWTADVALLSASFAANSRPILLTLEWAAALVLLIACTNIANMLLALTAERRTELAIRQALGASRWQIAWGTAGETLILTAAGGTLAILLATWIVATLNTTVSFQNINRLEPFHVDGLVLAFTGGLTMAVTFMFGILPAQVVLDAGVVDSLKESTHGVTTGMPNRGIRRALIVGEVALSIMLTTAALAFTRSALALHGLARGVTVDGVITAQVALSDLRYAETGRLVRVATSMLERLSKSPGVDGAALVNYPPLSVIRVTVPVAIEGQVPPPGQPWIARYWVAAPGYFHTMGVGLLAGRDFTSADDRTRAGVAVVSETFARRFWDTIDVVGKHVRPDFPKSNAFWIPRASGEMLTIVGVVSDVREDGLPDVAGLPQLYLPYAQNPTSTVTLMAHMTGRRPAQIAVLAIRDAVRTVDPDLAVSYEKTFDDVLLETFVRPRDLALLVGSFAMLALVLSGVGVYGVMAYLTTARTREIGIRIALGATRFNIVSLIVEHALVLTAAGIAIGIILAPIVLRLTNGMLFGVGPFDPVTLVTVAAVMAGVSIAASAIPAIRAARLGSVSFR